jgi:polyisoprenoid-binding protein YceI
MASTETPVRTLDGVALPAPGDWKIDPSHSTVEFVTRHLMVSKVRGRFSDVDGLIRIADDPAQSSVEVRIATASVDTRDAGRDEHLKSPDFFDIERYPEITFRSAGLEGSADQFRLTGELTVRDVTKPVVLDVEYFGVVDDPWGGRRIGFSASTEVDREDWGLTWNLALETGGVVVGKKVRLEIEVEAALQA